MCIEIELKKKGMETNLMKNEQKKASAMANKSKNANFGTNLIWPIPIFLLTFLLPAFPFGQFPIFLCIQSDLLLLAMAMGVIIWCLALSLSTFNYIDGIRPSS